MGVLTVSTVRALQFEVCSRASELPYDTIVLQLYQDSGIMFLVLTAALSIYGLPPGKETTCPEGLRNGQLFLNLVSLLWSWTVS